MHQHSKLNKIHPTASDYVGVILAAGVGSRLRPMTNTVPKCMVKTAGKPIIEYQINAYRTAGVKEIIIVAGYQGQAVRNYCKHINDIKVTVIDNQDYENTNNMYSFYLARNFIGQRPYILNNADLAIDPSIVNIMLHSEAASAVAVDTSQFIDESMKVVVNKDGFVCDISKKITKEKSSGCSIDFYKFSLQDGQEFISEVTSIIEEENNLKDWTEVALQRIFQMQKLKFSIIDVSELQWVEIDNYADLAIADRKFSNFDQDLENIKTVFLDLDGTVYVGSNLIEGARTTIAALRQMKKKIYFLSNNSSRNKLDYIEKLESMGIPSLDDDIILSTDAVLNYLKSEKVRKVHILGTNSLKRTFLDTGFQIDSPDPEFVVVGYDTELDYKKLIVACTHINKGVDMIATHCDAFCPSEVGPIPDIGALLEMLKISTGKMPIKIFGKPESTMVQHVLSRDKLDPSQVLFVGDRLHTDIQMAKNAGSRSLLVLTGETTRDVCQDSPIQPDYILPSLASLLN
jgi:HAD superfamily hydrolase (TIGR01450 family)